MLYICSKLFGMAMLVLQECISKLGAFKQAFGKQFGITKLGIFGSVARQENTEDSDRKKNSRNFLIVKLIWLGSGLHFALYLSRIS